MDANKTKRRCQSKRECVPVPSVLLRFLKRVNRLIDAKDASIQIVSDDLVQDKYAVGGLADKNRQLFEFTYFPDPHNKDEQWNLTLTRRTIRQIATGSKTFLALWNCSRCGCCNKSSVPARWCPRHNMPKPKPWRDYVRELRTACKPLDFKTREYLEAAFAKEDIAGIWQCLDDVLGKGILRTQDFQLAASQFYERFVRFTELPDSSG